MFALSFYYQLQVLIYFQNQHRLKISLTYVFSLYNVIVMLFDQLPDKFLHGFTAEAV